MTFDYGPKKPDGQHTRHPFMSQPDPIQEVRYTYRHRTCKTETKMGHAIAMTYATNPGFYGSTFCVECKGYFPVQQFVWPEDNKPINEAIAYSEPVED